MLFETSFTHSKSLLEKHGSVQINPRREEYNTRFLLI
jgi:hypothetical protein